MALVVLTLGVGAPGLCLTHCAVQEYRHEHQPGQGDHGHVAADFAGEDAPSAPPLVAPPAAIYPAVLPALLAVAALLAGRALIRLFAAAFASWIRPPSSPPPRLFTA